MDHIEAGALRCDLFWKSVCRGYGGFNHYESNSNSDTPPQPLSTLGWEGMLTDPDPPAGYGFSIIRRNMGTALRWMNEASDTAAMIPDGTETVASTKYAIADMRPMGGETYIVFQPTGNSITLKQVQTDMFYRYQWYDCTEGKVYPINQVFTDSVSNTFTVNAPFTPGQYGAALRFFRIDYDLPS